MSAYIAVVGNGPLKEQAATEIDAAKLVIRFNVPAHTVAEAGNRTDLIFIGNTGRMMKKWLNRGAFESSQHFASAHRIIFPRHPDNIINLHVQKNLVRKILGKNKIYVKLGIKSLTRLGKEVSLCPPELGLSCYKELGLPTNCKSETIPSTGFLAIKYVLNLYPEEQIRLYGFTWQGWSGHPWQAEYDWLSSCERILLPQHG